MIVGNIIGGGGGVPDTLILVDDSGNEYTAVMTEEEVTLDASENDIREGKVAATDKGVTTGTKVIPAYHTNQGVKVITAGSKVSITGLQQGDLYKFTKLQAIICDFNTSLTDSVASNKVSIDGYLYEVQSTEVLSSVTPNETDQTIDFGITNDTTKPQLLRYFTYKEDSIMSQNYDYAYAEIDPATRMCIGVQSGTLELEETETLIRIPEYNEDYVFKYYINGAWYEDAAGTIPWESSLI